MSSARGRGGPALLIVVLGAALLVVAAVHHGTELLALESRIGPLAALVLDGLPALALAAAGYWLLRTDLDRAEQWTVWLWTVSGAVLFVIVMGTTSLIRLLEGRSVAEPLFPLLIAAEAGGLAGLVAGYNKVRALRDAEEARTAREELAATNERLEASNERLEQFAYAASHDLREPLRMVQSYLGLLEERYRDRLDDDAREFIDYAVDGAERMQEMVESLLAYSRVETRAEPFELVDLDAVLDDVLNDLQLQVEAQDAEVTVEELPVVEGDGGQLRQVFQNLIDNAIEYSGDEPPRVHVSAERDGSEWVLSVRDEGIGIDPEQSERVFEVFQRLHTDEEHAGTGIGLAMCERIVERHGVRASDASSGSTGSQSESVGGEIWVESTPGEGTTFSFTLPAVDGEP